VDSYPTNEELLSRLDALAGRVASLESLVAELTRPSNGQSVHAVTHFESTPSLNGAAGETDHSKQAADSAPRKISPGLVDVIKLIAVGQGDEAHRKMRELPAEELREQPAVVALVAAALCVQRGDYSSGLTALTKARSLTDDARLLRVMQAIESQIK
jgi:hypothetical protein